MLLSFPGMAKYIHCCVKLRCLHSCRASWLELERSNLSLEQASTLPHIMYNIGNCAFHTLNMFSYTRIPDHMSANFNLRSSPWRMPNIFYL